MEVTRATYTLCFQTHSSIVKGTRGCDPIEKFSPTSWWKFLRITIFLILFYKFVPLENYPPPSLGSSSRPFSPLFGKRPALWRQAQRLCIHGFPSWSKELGVIQRKNSTYSAMNGLLDLCMSETLLAIEPPVNVCNDKTVIPLLQDYPSLGRW